MRVSNIWRKSKKLTKTILPEKQIALKRNTDALKLSLVYSLKTFYTKCLNCDNTFLWCSRNSCFNVTFHCSWHRFWDKGSYFGSRLIWFKLISFETTSSSVRGLFLVLANHTLIANFLFSRNYSFIILASKCHSSFE